MNPLIVFDGNALAAQKKKALLADVARLQERGHALTIAAVYFTEDAASQLYTSLKQEAAQEVGISYQTHGFSFQDGAETVVSMIKELNADPAITGIIIQKPRRTLWATRKRVQGDAKDVRQAFGSWWRYLTQTIQPSKDVDGLHPQTLQAIAAGTWRAEQRVLPATAQAILDILQEAATYPELNQSVTQGKIAVIGKSDIVGLPVAYALQNQGREVLLLGTADLQERIKRGIFVRDCQVVVSATGQAGLITREMIGEGVVLIDVGEPRPDVDSTSVAHAAAFLTPVPGGVGPVTVICLLENCVTLAASQATVQ